jgi:hypothetical protein
VNQSAAWAKALDRIEICNVRRNWLAGAAV